AATIYFSHLILKLATFNHHLNLVLEIKKWFSELFSPECEEKWFFELLVWTGKGKWFSELFDSLSSLVWNGKGKCSMLELEKVLLAFRLVREIGERKRFLNFISGYKSFFAKFPSDTLPWKSDKF
ncbi:hypothetical protein C1645_832614, partial [Glomus cerebriforme]